MSLINPFNIFFSLSLFLFLILFSFSFSFIFSPLHKLLPINLSKTRFGPRTYPLIGCLISFSRNRTRLLDWYTELLTESPTQTIVVSRLGARKTIVTANPANVEYILKTNFPNFPKGNFFAEILGDLLGKGIFNVDGELWASQRKMASHEFTTKSLREFVVKTLEYEVEGRLIPLLESAAMENKIIDLQEVLKRFTYDTICMLSLGTDPNCLDISLPIPPLIRAFDTAAAISATRATSPVSATWKLKRLLNLGSERHLKDAITTVHSVVNDIIDAKQNSLQQNGDDQVNHQHDLLSRFLSSGYNRDLAVDMVISFIMAGRDTTAAAMTWLFWLLLSNNDPTPRDTIRAELVQCSGSGSGPLGYEAIKREMMYLHSCLCEAMRLYPPVAWDSKHAQNDDVLPDGTRVKRGDRVTYFPYGMGRMKTIWGKDRFNFRPDRWFDQTGVNEPVHRGSRALKMVSPYVFPVFQAGPRVCLGKEMAFIEMKYVVASVISRFDFEPVCLDTPVLVPLLTAHMNGGFKVRVTKRSM